MYQVSLKFLVKLLFVLDKKYYEAVKKEQENSTEQ
jgi:hypothetical protein